MSLKSALVAYQQEKKDKEISVKIQAMIDEQKALLNSNHTGSVTATNKTTKTWNPNILTEGGVSYYKLNNKCYRVSVCNGDNDIILKFKIKTALDKTLSVSAKTLKQAQSVVDDIFGKGKYIVSACCL
jgi:ribosomal protein L28